MQLRQLGNSNLMVSPIAVGFWGIVGGDYWGPQDETDTINTVSAALDGGAAVDEVGCGRFQCSTACR